jgi:uracil-DNA glycosylase
MVLISEAVPNNEEDYFDGKGIPKFIQNTNQLFNSIGYNYKSYQDYLENGIYLTTAIKCSKKDYLVSAKTIEECSYILEKELEQFGNIKVIMLMGDFAIKAINYIWKRKYKNRIIPSGSTYKLRKEQYVDRGIRFFPSYTQTGDSFGIEKSKIAMMTEDLKIGMDIIGK